MQQYSSESIQKTIDLCREEMAKSDALSPVLKNTIELILQILMYPLVKTTPRNSSIIAPCLLLGTQTSVQKEGQNQGFPLVVKRTSRGHPSASREARSSYSDTDSRRMLPRVIAMSVTRRARYSTSSLNGMLSSIGQTYTKMTRGIVWLFRLT